MKNKVLHKYLKNVHRVEGWVTEEAIFLITTLNEAQIRLGVEGHVGEIGVHYGKLFVLLYLLARPEENAVAIDVFERQDLNVDHSGHGDYETLLTNLRSYAGGTDRLRVIKGDSTELRCEDVETAAGGRLRLFSIDGGHTARVTLHDLGTASGVLAEGGIALLDDYFNEAWPGVSEGTNQFFSLRGGPGLNLVPFAIGGNKVFLSTPHHAGTYISHLLGRRGFCFIERELFGHPVICYCPPPESVATRLTKTSVWQAIRDTPLGAGIRRGLKLMRGRSK